MNSEKRKQLLKKLEQGYCVPSLSPLAVKLISLAADEDTSATDLEKVIEKDPAMTMRLLNLANSLFYRSSYPVITLKKAIVKIGFDRLRLMALSLSLRETFPYGKVGGMDYVLFWKISLYRAILARSLAESVNGCNPEEAFVAGLTLEIGLLIFYTLFFEKQEIEIRQDNIPLLLKSQTEKIGINHREVGDAALRYFGFPEKYIQCQLAYGEKLKGKELDPIILVVNGAMELSSFVFSKSTGFVPPVMKIKKITGLSTEKIYNCVIETFDCVDNIANKLKVEANSATDVLIVMEKAQHVIETVKTKLETHLKPLSDQYKMALRDTSRKQEIEKKITAVLAKLSTVIQFIRQFIQKLSLTFEPFSIAGQLSAELLSQTVRLDIEIEKVHMSFSKILRR